MIKQSERLNLSQSLAIFEDNLDDIMDALAINLTAKLEALPPLIQSDNENLQWIRDEVRKLEIEQITEAPLRIIRRIQSRKYYQSVEGQHNVDRVTDEDIARAKDIPIEELYDDKLSRSGSRQWGKCPFHEESTPSFCIHADNRWSCFGACGEHGDVIDFVQKQNGIKFIPTVKSLVR